MKVLILCTGNSCRSQMAEGFLKSFDRNLEVFSAGTSPASSVNLFAIKAMAESGMDISANKAKSVENFLNEEFDYVITVCDNAKKSCPVFSGNVRHRLHIGFEDPADAKGSDEEIMNTYRRVRDLIKKEFRNFYMSEINPPSGE